MNSKQREKVKKNSYLAVKDLQPSLYWNLFCQLSHIPRGSKNEKAAAQWVKEVCKKEGLENVKTDKNGNVIILVPASSPELNHVPIVILQAHLDIVCEKNGDVTHDFKTDPIEVMLSDGWVHARGTTLGADDACGVCTGLGLAIERDSFKHGPFKVLLTVEEETGCYGAKDLSEEILLDSKYLLNLDTSPFGTFINGCAGGQTTWIRKSFNKKKAIVSEEKNVLLKIKVGGLMGGHSGKDIEKKRGNSIKFLFMILRRIQERQIEVGLCDLNGGNLLNAIPREATCWITTKCENTDEIISIAAKVEESVVGAGTAGKFFARVEKCDDEKMKKKKCWCMEKEVFESLGNLIDSLKVGVRFGLTDPVQNSCNLASIKVNMEEGKLEIGCHARSATVENQERMYREIVQLCKDNNFELESKLEFSPWKVNDKSELKKIACDVFKSMFKKDPVVRMVHAGLESSIFVEKNPKLDLIAFGPNLVAQHSPQERVEASSCLKSYNLTRSIVQKICELEK